MILQINLFSLMLIFLACDKEVEQSQQVSKQENDALHLTQANNETKEALLDIADFLEEARTIDSQEQKTSRGFTKKAINLNQKMAIVSARYGRYFASTSGVDFDAVASLSGKLGNHTSGALILRKIVRGFIEDIDFSAFVDISKVEFVPGLVPDDIKYVMKVYPNKLDADTKLAFLVEFFRKQSEHPDEDLTIEEIMPIYASKVGPIKGSLLQLGVEAIADQELKNRWRVLIQSAARKIDTTRKHELKAKLFKGDINWELMGTSHDGTIGSVVFSFNKKTRETEAIKILHPNIKRRVEQDYEIFQKIFSEVSFAKASNRYFLLDYVNTKRMETDLDGERLRIKEGFRHYGNRGNVSCVELSPYDNPKENRDFLRMKRIPGITLTSFFTKLATNEKQEKYQKGMADLMESSKIDEVRSAIANGFSIWLSTILNDGFAHLDPHSGNWIIDWEASPAKIYFTDFGSAGRLQHDTKIGIFYYLFGIYLRTPFLFSWSIAKNLREGMTVPRNFNEKLKARVVSSAEPWAAFDLLVSDENLAFSSDFFKAKHAFSRAYSIIPGLETSVDFANNKFAKKIRTKDIFLTLREIGIRNLGYAIKIGVHESFYAFGRTLVKGVQTVASKTWSMLSAVGGLVKSYQQGRNYNEKKEEQLFVEDYEGRCEVYDSDKLVYCWRFSELYNNVIDNFCGQIRNKEGSLRSQWFRNSECPEEARRVCEIHDENILYLAGDVRLYSYKTDECF